MSRKYDDIIHLPHHVSQTHPRMPMQDRAAQFSPFAALTGYGAVIRETGRLTERRPELDEDAKSELDRRIALLSALLENRPLVTVTYFQPDARKAGGAYLTAAGAAKKLDAHAGLLLLQDGTRIPVAEIVRIDGALFRGWEQPLPPD